MNSLEELMAMADMNPDGENLKRILKQFKEYILNRFRNNQKQVWSEQDKKEFHREVIDWIAQNKLKEIYKLTDEQLLAVAMIVESKWMNEQKQMAEQFASIQEQRGQALERFIAAMKDMGLTPEELKELFQ